MALSAEELQQLQQWYGGTHSSGQDSITIGGQTYGTIGVSHNDEGGSSYTPNELISYDPTHLKPKDKYNIIDPTTGSSSGEGSWLDGGGLDGIGMLTLALITGGALGAFDAFLPGVQGAGATVGADGLAAGGSAAGGAGGAAASLDPALTTQGNSINALDHLTGVDYGSTVMGPDGVGPALSEGGAAGAGGAATGAGGAAAGTGAAAGGAGPGSTAAGAGAAGTGLTAAQVASGAGTVANLVKAGTSIASGVDANNRANQIAHQSDPFAQYRDKFGKALVDLWDDPSTITKMPGYQAGMTAVERSLGAQGYTGSGNMMAALQEYGGGFFDKTLQELSGLSGATVTPGNGAIQAANLAGQGQGSVGYGVNSLVDYFTGNSTGQSGAGSTSVQSGSNQGYLGPTTPDGYYM